MQQDPDANLDPGTSSVRFLSLSRLTANSSFLHTHTHFDLFFGTPLGVIALAILRSSYVEIRGAL